MHQKLQDLKLHETRTGPRKFASNRMLSELNLQIKGGLPTWILLTPTCYGNEVVTRSLDNPPPFPQPRRPLRSTKQ